jgi:hypothetical protein
VEDEGRGSKTMAAEAAEQRITQALQKELEKVDKECMRPLQVRSLSLYSIYMKMLHGGVVKCSPGALYYFMATCRCVLSVAVPVVLKIV